MGHGAKGPRLQNRGAFMDALGRGVDSRAAAVEPVNVNCRAGQTDHGAVGGVGGVGYRTSGAQ